MTDGTNACLAYAFPSDVDRLKIISTPSPVYIIADSFRKAPCQVFRCDGERGAVIESVTHFCVTVEVSRSLAVVK